MFGISRPLTLPAGGDRTDEVVWLAWLRRNALEERDREHVRALALQAGCIAVLLFTALLWSRASDYAAAIRFAVSAGAVFAAIRAFHQRRSVAVVAFTVIALIYNPIFPVFILSGAAALATILATAGAIGALMACWRTSPG